MTEPLPDEVDDALWAEACRRAAAIRRFLLSNSGQSTVAAISDLASELQVSQATTYRLLRRFRADGTVMSLVEAKRGRPTGHRALDAQREEIIEKAIRTYYLKPTRPTVSQLVRDIETNCAEVGLKPPHRRTIERRLGDLDLRHRAQRRGETRIEKATMPVPGTLSTSRPLEIVQIDHTKADIFVVDEESREPIGRPWLTLAMDVFSRMVTGFYLTMDAPSRLSTSLCLLHSVYDKTTWLKAREIEEPWPVAGLPDRVHVDNGADFRSRAFKRGCENCDRLAAAGYTALRRTYRAADRHPNGTAAPSARHDL